MYDRLVKGGRVLDPSQGVDEPLDVALEDGKVALLASDIDGALSRRTLDATGLIVTPGLIDMHAHVHWGVSHYGVMPDTSCLARGATTVVDAGSSGGHTFPSLKRYIIDPAQTRVLAFLNIAYMGMIGDNVGELEDARFIDEDLAARVGKSGLIVGIKARMDRVGKLLATEPLQRAIDVGEALGKPVMVHIGRESRMNVSLADVLELMRPGDIVTHTYHGLDGGIVGSDGRLRREVREARERGVLFDVGHGSGSFAFATARAAIDQGLLPDAISSDLHTYSMTGPVFDLPTTMSKFLHLGLSLEQVIERTTSGPATILGVADRLGTLSPGADGDLCMLELQKGRHAFIDSARQIEIGARRIAPIHVIRAGRHSFQGPGI